MEQPLDALCVQARVLQPSVVVSWTGIFKKRHHPLTLPVNSLSKGRIAFETFVFVIWPITWQGCAAPAPKPSQAVDLSTSLEVVNYSIQRPGSDY